MAEVVGLAASLVTLINLTRTISQAVSRFVRTATGAESSLKGLLANVDSLSTIFVALQGQLETKASQSASLQHVDRLLLLCEEILSRIHLRLEKVKVVGNYVVGIIIDKQTSKLLKRLDEIVPVLQLALEADNLTSSHTIESLVHSLQLENAEQNEQLRNDIRSTHQDTLKWHEEVKEASKKSADIQLHKSILDWLRIADIHSNHRAAIQRHLPGTGQWLLDGDDFRKWEAGYQPHLWLHAMGKPESSSAIIQYLISRHSHSRVAYFYFDFKDVTKQDVLSLLAALITQVARNIDPFPEILLELYRRHSVRDPSHPSIPAASELIDVLVSLMNLHQDYYVVIDALDECRERPLLLEIIPALINRTTSQCRILCTSRWELDIKVSMDCLPINTVRIRPEQVDSDVSLFVRAVLQNDERLSCHRQGIKDLILERLSKGAQGMFRWVQCQVDHIKLLRTARDVKVALERLPPDLDSTYDDILLRVQSADREYLKRALQFVVFAVRPMTLVEVAEAVIIEPEISEVDEDARLQTPTDLLEIGRSLFVLGYHESHRDPILELSHYSVKEYLVSERAACGPAGYFALDKVSADTHIAKCSLTYLGLDYFEEIWQEFDRNTWNCEEGPDPVLATSFLLDQHYERLRNYPFLSYAAKKCFVHCKDEVVQRAIAPTLLKAFTTERNGRFVNMTYTCVCNKNDPGTTSYHRAFRYSLISVAARYGLAVIVQLLLDHGVAADCLPLKPCWIEPWPEGQTALHRAADFGYEKICKMLIGAGANLHGTHPADCPLAAAGRSGKAAIVQLMLDSGVDIRRDPFPLTETMLVAWLKYAEGVEKWKAILDKMRNAGVLWSTVGLLAAFSNFVAPHVRCIADWLDSDSRRSDPEILHNVTHSVIDDVDVKTLTALHWLLKDSGGIEGVKSSLKTVLSQLLDSQPQLFAQKATGPIQKYTVEEVIAENMIYRYFSVAPTPQQDATQSIQSLEKLRPSTELLATGWDLLAEPLDSELVICGPVLLAFVRNRWDPLYAHFFD